MVGENAKMILNMRWTRHLFVDGPPMILREILEKGDKVLASVFRTFIINY